MAIGGRIVLMLDGHRAAITVRPVLISPLLYCQDCLLKSQRLFPTALDPPIPSVFTHVNQVLTPVGPDCANASTSLNIFWFLELATVS